MRNRESLPRGGMTLVELLVVIGIIVLVAAVAAPAIRPQLKDRRLREASRQLNTFISGAKARAAETNRPMGIWIKRDTLPGREAGAFQIFMAETPIPFAGETIGATATLADSGGGFANQATFADPQNLVKAGDVIQFNYRGPKYLINSASNGTVTFSSPSNLPLPKVPTTGLQLPFQVTRQPLRAGGAPLELSSGTVIDLEWSGVGAAGQEMKTGGNDVVIMFTPTGAVDKIYGFNVTVPSTIHLLVGRTDHLSALQDNTTDVQKSNLFDPTVSWVSIGHLTGTVTTAENYVTNPVGLSATATGAQIAEARKIAISKQTMGGR